MTAPQLAGLVLCAAGALPLAALAVAALRARRLPRVRWGAWGAWGAWGMARGTEQALGHGRAR